ncbi:MAG: photosystem II protein Y [Cyanobacteria bacterium P01_G01_bin.54]
MDWRLIVVFGPLLIAAGWAGFNIFAAALNQLQTVLDKRKP